MRIVALLLLITPLAVSAQQERRISRADLRDKIAGGWAGQMIGVSFGAPTEFKARGVPIEGELAPWDPASVTNALGQDDLYVDMTFAQVLDDKGLDATTEDFAAMFRDSRYSLWHANLAARRNLRRGIPAALAGTPRYNAHANDIDFQIEADFIGLMAPGLPQWSNEMSWRVGRIMNYGDGIYGGMFVSCMYAAAFFEKAPRKIVEAGLACIPSRSPYGEIIRDVLSWSRRHRRDWRKTWALIEEKWDRRDPCPAGALTPFNIDAKLNGAYIALGLLYGDGDMGKTIEISTRAGQDSDCNPASAAGILGVMLGYRAIPDEWKSGIPAVAGKKFAYTGYSFETIVESTEKRALALIARTGGRIEGDTVVVRTERPKAAKREVWDDYGSPVERIPVTDPRWSFTGDWKARPAHPGRSSSAAGAEAVITFEGTGAIVTGPYLVTGGLLDVYLDGKLDRTLDVYSDERGSREGESVWHAFGLRNCAHTLRLVVRGEKYKDSTGADVAIDGLIVFR